MARNGSGEFSLVGADFTNGTLADADEVMAKLDDIATALTQSLAKDGQTVPTAALPMGTFNHTNVGVATAPTHYARASQIADGALTYGGVAGGTADALTIAPSPAITAYVVGQQFQFKVGASANTGAATLNVSTVGAGAITWPDGTALTAGDLPANAMVVVVVQATTPVFHLQTKTSTSLPTSTAATKAALLAGDRQRIWGLTYANNGSDATNDIDIAAGGCMDATGAYWIAVSAITKRLDASWAVGTNQGGLDTGSIGNSDYYIWAIARSDTGVTDVLFSLSSTAPTMPTNYDFKRLIGWFKRVSATIVPFTTYELPGGGLELKWTTPTLDFDLSNTLTTSRRTDALKVPLNFSVDAQARFVLSDNTSSFVAVVYCPDEADVAPSVTAAPLGNFYNAVTAQPEVKELRVRTSSTGTIAARANLATVDVYRAVTLGFQWSRR